NSPEVFKWVTSLSPDYVILFGSGIIKDPLLSYYKNKMINMHLGLSPYYRGGGTNFWPLVNGEPECVGVTIHLATADVDGGPILSQERPDVEIGDGPHDIGCKTIIAGTDLMIKCIREYKRGRITPTPQKPGGKLYKRKDFNADAVRKMLKNFESGMIEEYLKNKAERDRNYPIIQKCA
ncbi:MAG: formyl transferase, partial [Candidatus Hadarchaeota archaeon]